jgi:hypothetical protein
MAQTASSPQRSDESAIRENPTHGYRTKHCLLGGHLRSDALDGRRPQRNCFVAASDENWTFGARPVPPCSHLLTRNMLMTGT